MDWAGSLYKGLSVVVAVASVPIIVVMVMFGVLPAAAVPLSGNELRLLAVCGVALGGWLAWYYLTAVFWRHGSAGLQQTSRLWWLALLAAMVLSVWMLVPLLLSIVHTRTVNAVSVGMLAGPVAVSYLWYLRHRAY